MCANFNALININQAFARNKAEQIVTSLKELYGRNKISARLLFSDTLISPNKTLGPC
jgi:hypothetical protein